MKSRHAWHAEMCFNCAHLDIRERRDGKVFYWCAKKRGPVSDDFIWRTDCRRFEPVKKAEPPIRAQGG